jgi:hypothetical protein
LPHAIIPPHAIKAQHSVGICVGIWKNHLMQIPTEQQLRGQHGFDRHVCEADQVGRHQQQATSTLTGDGMYLHVKEAGRYWRMSYSFLAKQKTLALGVYPEISLAKARKRRDKARELLAEGCDPSAAKQDEQQAKQAEAANTFERVAVSG